MRKMHIGLLMITCFLLQVFQSYSQDTLYWVGGQGYWGESAHWSLSSGGAGGAGVPTRFISAVFDQSSFSGSAEVYYDQGSGPYFTSVECNDMIWRNINPTFQITLRGAKPIFIFGRLEYISNMDFYFTGQTTFAASGKTVTVKTAGNSIPAGAIFDGNGGHWNLQDDFYVLGNFDINHGHVITNNHKITCYRLNSAPVNPINVRSLNLGSSLVTIRSMNSLTNISSRITNLGGSMKVYSGGTSKILFTGDITEPGSMCTFDAADSLKFDNVEFVRNGTLIAQHDTFNVVLFGQNGTMHVDTCIFDTVEIHQLGLAYSNKSTYNRFLFSTQPSYWCSCCDVRNHDYGLLQGNNNHIVYKVDFNRNGTIKGDNNDADTCRFNANGSLLTGANTFNTMMMRRIWVYGCSCPAYSKDTLTLEQNKTQTIHDTLDLFGPYYCEHTRITSNSSGQATLSTNRIQNQDYIELKGIIGNVLLPPVNSDTAIRSIDLGNNSNWFFKNSYIPLTGSVEQVTNVSPCSYDHNGTVTLAGFGGEPPYTYHIYTGSNNCYGGYTANTPPTNNVFTGLYKQNYQFKIMDKYGCESALVNATVGGPDQLVIDSIKIVPIPCLPVPASSNGGQIIVYAKGGTGELNYSINNGGGWQVSNTFNQVNTVGKYYVQVKDAVNCTTDLVEVTMYKRPDLNMIIQTPEIVKCWGDSSGIMKIQTWGGLAPYQVTITPISTVHNQNPVLWTIPVENLGNPTIILVHAGSYHIIITDANGCTIEDFRQVFENPRLDYIYEKTTVSGPPTTYCLKVIPSGGKPPYTHLWNNGTTTEEACGLIPGTWCDTVTDILGCRDTACILIEPLSIALSTDTVCFGACTGFICANAAGGSTPYTYLWSTSATNSCINNACSGNYSVTVTDASGGIVTGSTVIQENPQINAIFSTFNVSCFGGNNGSLKVTASGGTQFSGTELYTYLWSNNSTTDSIGGLTAGNYTVTVTDSIGCQGVFSSVVTQPSAIDATINSYSTDLCATYAALVTASGGTPPYTYAWSNSQTSNPAIGLFPGTYTVTVTDVKSCTKVASVTITALSVATISTNVTCYGGCNGTATATASGGNKPYAITWTKIPEGSTVLPSSTTPVSSTISNLCPGIYLATVVDSNNCSVQKFVTISQPSNSLTIDLLVFDLNKMEPCFGDCKEVVTAYSSGGTPPYTYEWKNLTTNVIYGVTINKKTDLCAGQYQLTVKDINNCAKDTLFTINQPQELKIEQYSKKDINCFTDGDVGEIKIENLSGGVAPFTYSINCPLLPSYTPVNLFTNLPPAPYSIGARDVNGCLSVCLPVTIYRPADLIVSNSVKVNPSGFNLCNGSITNTASGGTAPYEHRWHKMPNTSIYSTQTGVTTTISDLCAGTYCDTVVDAHGCIKSICITLPEPSQLNIQIDSSNISCFGEQDGWIELTVSGGVPPYSVQYNGQTSILSSAPYTFRIEDLPAGSYSFMVTDANQNPAFRTVVINEPDPVIINFEAHDVCYGSTNGFIIATPAQGTPPYRFLWSNGGTTNQISNLAANLWYYLTVTDFRDCVAHDSVFLPENPQLFVQINNIDSSVCKFDSIQMNVDAYGGYYPYTFSWSPVTGISNPLLLEPKISPSFGETYVITMTDLKGCTTSDSIAISIDSVPVAQFSYTQICQSRTVQFTNQSAGYPTSGLDYLWDFGDGNQSTLKDPEHTFSGAFGSYNVSLTVFSNEGCSDYKMDTITINPIIQVEFQADTACLGTPTQLWAQSLNPATTVTQMKWYFDNQPPVLVVPPPFNITNTFSYAGTHTVKLVMTDTTGCSDSVTKPVLVRAAPATDFTYTWHCTSDTVWFTDITQGSGSDTTYQWEFGDPGSGALNFSNLQNPYHVYHISGVYDVKLTVSYPYGTGEACSKTKIHQLFYIKSPKAAYSYANPCFGQPTQFTDLSYAATGNIVLWTWDFDDSGSGIQNISNFQNPSHTFTAPGIYDVKLKVYDNTLCYDSVVKTVVILAPPVADFHAHDTCVNQITVFEDLSFPVDTTLSQWHWDFGDSQSSTYTAYQAQTLHLYTLAGSYTVTLTVTDKNGCSHTKTKIVNVFPSPTAMFQFSPACANQLTYFTDFSNGSGSSITTWNWNFGDPGGGSNTSTLQHPSHIYTTNGMYNVTLCVQNAQGCINCYTQAVNIHPTPVASFTADTACKGTPTHFNNLSFCLGDNITSWTWNFGDGTLTSNVQWPVHTFLTAGTFNVSLIVTTQNGCSADTVIPIVVHENPVAGFSYSSPSGTSCYHSGEATHFTDLSTITGGNIINQWNWNFGDGGFSTDQNPVHTFAGAGTYFVTLEVIDIHGCRHTVVKPVMLSEGPMTSYTYSISRCDSAQFINHSISLAIPIVSYLWDFDDLPSGVNNFSTEENPVHVFFTPVTKTYQVRLIVTDSLGCQDTLVRPVTVSKPVADFSVESSCIGEAAQFQDLSVSDSNFIASWSWDFGDPLSGSNSSALQNPIHVYGSPGTYFVLLTITNGNGCTAITGKTIHVSYPPNANWSYQQPNCFPDSIHFLDLSVPQGTMPIVKWSWDFGDGNHSGDANPVHKYTTAGTYVVTLTVKNGDSCKDEFSQPFHYYPGPTASFTHNPVSKCRNSVVSFNDLSSASFGDVVERDWDFGDGTAHSALTNPTHVYLTGGTFTVTLVVFDQRGCSDTVAQTIVINDLPAPDFRADTACLGDMTIFMNLNPTTGTSWLWNFGEPFPPELNTSAASDPSHTYLTVGDFYVRLTATDNNGCINDTLKKITVVPVPVVNFSNSNPCSGQQVHFTDESIIYQGDKIAWAWDFGDPGSGTANTSDLQNPTHVFSQPNTYNVTLILTTTGNCSVISFTKQVTIRPAPIVAFTNSSPCNGESIEFTDQTNQNGGTTLVLWQWNFGDLLSGLSNTSVLQNPIHLFSGPGSYLVELIVTNADGCSDTLTKTVDVLSKPGVDFTFGPACASDTLCFSVDEVATPVGKIVSYRWDLNGDGVIESILKNPCYFYATSGLVNVTLTVVDTNGCESSKTHAVDIKPQPIANFHVPGPNCNGLPVDFVDYSSPVAGHITSWTWHFDDGSPDVTVNFPANGNVSHIFPGFGPYNVTLRVVSSHGCSDTTSRIITPEPSPTANFTYAAPCAERQVQFTDISTTGGGVMISSWSWDFGDPATGINNVSVLANPIHTYETAGVYSVRLIVRNLNNCYDTIIIPITVNLRPVANFAADTACAKSPVTFTDLSIPNANGSIIAWFWEFGGGITSTLVNPTHIYNTHGIYPVKLTVTNSNGCTRDTTIDVLVNPLATPEFSYPENHCGNSEICFTDHSTTPSGYLGYIVQWRWDFGDGSPVETIDFPASPNACHTFSGNALSHDVTLTVMTSDSCVSTIMKTVNSLPYPVANFEYSTVACENQQVAFTDLTQLNGGVPLTYWHWDFGDPTSGSANTSTLQNPGHTYASTGTYTVRLISFNTHNCSDTIEKTIEINQAPVANFSADTVCVGSPMTFTNASVPNAGSVSTFLWNFGDNQTSTDENPVHTYTTSGIFNVTLTLTNANGCIHDTVKQVVVNPKPLSGFTWTSPACDSTMVYFTDQSSVPTGTIGHIMQWKWDFGDGSPVVTIDFPASPNVMHIFTGNAFDYNVKLVATADYGCQDSVVHAIHLVPAPTASFEVIPGTPVCVAQEVQFHDLSAENGGGTINSRTWIFDDPGSGVNNTSTQQNPTHIFMGGSGIYNVRLIIVNLNNCADTIIKPVFIRPAPPVDFTNDQTCANQVVNFAANPLIMTAGSIETWDWDFGDGTLHSTNPGSAAHQYASTGTYQAVLTVFDTNGCSNSVTKTIQIVPAPIPAFSFTSATCDSTPVQFTDQSVVTAGFPGFISQWKWYWGDGTSTVIDHPTSPNVSHLFPAGVYNFNVKLVVKSSFGCRDSVSHPLNLIPVPIASFEVVPGTPTCVSQPVQFHDLSQSNGGGSITAWLWNFGDPGSGSNNNSTSPAPSHIFMTAGTYQVILKVTNSNGCISSDTVPVAIDLLPVADFIADTACAGSITHFTDSSTTTGTISSYTWDFGDGGTSTLSSPQHTYATFGIFNVTLTIVNNKGCIHSVTKPVLVSPKPVPSFTYSETSCIGNPVTYTDHSFIPSGFPGYIKTWIWNFGDGSAPITINYPGTPNVTHTFLGVATSHIVTLTTVSTANCSDSIQQTITSIPSPIANFSHSDATCFGYPVDFTDLSQMNGGGSIQSWNWNFGDPLSGANNTTTIQHPGHTFTDSGKYKVSLQVTSTNGCTHLWSDSVTIYGLPTANFTNSIGCEGDLISFNSNTSVPNGSAIVSHTWSFGDGGTSGLANPEHMYLSFGIYNVTLTVVDSIGCTNSIVKQVTVNPKPIPAFTFSSGTCDSVPVSFTNLSQMPAGFPGFIKKWVWVWGDGSSDTIIHPTSPNVSHLFPAGVYSFNVKLVVTTSFDCRDSVEHEVILIPFPVASFEVLPGTPTCAMQPVQFNDLSQTNGGGNITGWLWNFDDPGSGSNNTSPSPSPSHVFAAAGLYHVVLRVTNANGCFNADTIAISIAERPVANFTANTSCEDSATQFSNQSLSPGSTITSYNWSFGDGGTSTLQSPTHTYAAFGTYNATLTIVNNNGCTHSVTKQVMVSPKPVPAFTFSQTSCVGLPVTFTDYSFIPSGFTSSIKTWIWKFGDGSAPVTINAPASPNLDHTFLGNATSHTVWLIVITTGNCSDSVSRTVNSVPSPISGFTLSNATCLGQSVQFTDVSQVNGGGSIQTWNWNFGDPLSGTNNSSTLQHPAHSFTATGNFTVSLTVTSANGCVNVHDTIVSVDSLPSANFTFTTVCEGTLTTLTDSSQANAGPTGSIVSYAWDFGDGVTSTLHSPQHTFASYGNYTVSLTVVNSNGCVHSISKTVVVNPKPIVEFTYSPSGCSGLPVTFYNQSFIPTGFSATIISWEWNFGDGSVPTVVNFPGNPDITHTFLGAATSHIVRLTVTTSTGCVHFIEKTVVSALSPIANFSFSPANCINQPVEFHDLTQTNGGANLQNWSWNFGDPLSGANNTSTLQNPPHSFTGTGPFTVNLIVTNISGCTHSLDTVITIHPLPVANFTNSIVCEGNLTEFTNTSQPLPGDTSSIVSYSWNFGDGGTSVAQSPQHTFASYGNYTVTLTVVNSRGCIHSVSKIVIVNPKPVTQFTYTPSGCLGSPVAFYDQSYIPSGFSATISKWVWNFGDNTLPVTILSGGNPNVTHVFAGSASQHLVTLTVTTSMGCADSVQIMVTSELSPLANFSYSSAQCVNQPIQFTDLTQVNGGTGLQTWSWNFGDGLSGANNTSTLKNPTHSFTGTGTFIVTLVVTNISGCSHTKDTIININPLPVANFTYLTVCEGTPTTFTDNSQANAGTTGTIVSYSWNFGDGGTSSGTTASHTFATYGTYTVTLTVVNSNGCIHSVSKPVFVNPKAIAEFTYSPSGCLGDPVMFYNQSFIPLGTLSYVDQWVWDFGDGTAPVTIGSAGNPNISHQFAGSSLSHVVRLTVRTFPGGCFSFIEKTVNSVPAPIASFSFSSTACANQPMQFTDLSQTGGGGNIQSWSWNFGDPLSGANNSASIQNPSHQFTSSAGSPYSVRLVVTNGNGCSDTLITPVSVNVRPLANFTADTVCLGTVTTFTDISNPVSGSITTRSWDFGDGAYSTLPNPAHLFASAGTFNVKLTVSNTLGCQKDTVKSILVLGKPVASFSHSSPDCAGDSVQFTDLSFTPHGYIEQWEWNFGDGSVTPPILFPANQNIKHKFTNGGNYNVTLTITTSDGCTVQKTSLVQISARPLVNFTFGSVACPLLPMSFTDLSQVNGGSAITGWSWNFGDPASGVNNTSTLQNPTHSFSASGTFTVRLIVTNANGCVDSIPNGVKTVTVNSSPVAAFSVENLCLGGPAIFTDASTPAGSIATWSWNFDDPLSGANNTSGVQNPTHIFTTLGTYHVTLSVSTSEQCARDTMMVVNIIPKPIAMFQYGNSCDSSNTLFTSTSTAPNSSIVNWDWDFGDGVTLSGVFPTASHLYTTSGTHMVKLVVENIDGCYDSVTLPVLTRPQPVAAFDYMSHYCPAGKVDFTDVSQGVGGASVITSNWIFVPGGPVNSGSNPFYNYPTPNMKYLVTLMVEDNYHCWDTIADSIFVKPGWGFSFRADTVCFGSNTHFTPVNLAAGDTLNPVSWEFGDPSSSPNNTSTLYSPTHKFTHPGVFPVKFKVQNFDRCVDSIFLNVKVWAPPQPLFSYSALPCDSILHFTDSTQIIGDGPIDEWRWTWGDGSTSTITSPPGNTTHKFSNSGIYPVTLAMTTIHGCTDSVTKNVQRFPCIQAGFSFADTLCARYKIAFSDTSLPVSGGINHWKWTWGDGSSSIYTKRTSPVYHTYADSGIYSVNLEVQATVNGTTVVDNMGGTVIIRPTPKTYFANPPVCLNQITLFRDTSKTYGEPTVGRTWYFSKNPLDKSSLPNPQHLYDTSGTYNVKLVVNNSYGCRDSLTKPTRVFRLPIADFIAEAACSGDSARFFDQTAMADTSIGFWRWSFGDATSMNDTSILENPKYRYLTTGDYPIRLIVTDKSGCMDTIDSTLTVRQSPTASFTMTKNYNGTPGTIQLNNLTSTMESYEWKFPGGKGYPEEESPIVQYAEDGEFEITLIVTDNGCLDSTTMLYEFIFEDLYVPNAFAPTSLLDGKGLEVRQFLPKGRNLQEYHVMVFDKWGHLLWESKKLDCDITPNSCIGRPMEYWDGTFNGELMPQDVYMWKINAKFTNGKVWEGSDSGTGSISTMGTVTLIR